MGPLAAALDDDDDAGCGADGCVHFVRVGVGLLLQYASFCAAIRALMSESDDEPSLVTGGRDGGRVGDVGRVL